MAERGRESATWHSCTEIGASLRERCDGDASCARRVTTDVTRPCYAGRYAAATEDSPESLSPCFWDRGPAPPATPSEYATRTCDEIVEARLRPACVEELRTVIEEICEEGSTDLTGAGP